MSCTTYRLTKQSDTTCGDNNVSGWQGEEKVFSLSVWKIVIFVSQYSNQ